MGAESAVYHIKPEESMPRCIDTLVVVMIKAVSVH